VRLFPLTDKIFNTGKSVNKQVGKEPRIFTVGVKAVKSYENVLLTAEDDEEDDFECVFGNRFGTIVCRHVPAVFKPSNDNTFKCFASQKLAGIVP
jgi:hypothetical protein